MLNKYQSLNIYFKTVIWAILFTFAIVIALIPLFFFDLMEIPLGLLIGGLFGALYYLLAGLNQRENYSKSSMVLDIFLLILRFVLFASILVGLAFLYYQAGIHYINIFAFAGAYLISLLIFIILGRKETK